MLKRHQRGEMPRLGWLDTLAVQEIHARRAKVMVDVKRINTCRPCTSGNTPYSVIPKPLRPQCIAADTAAGHLDLILQLPDFAHPIIYHHTPTGGGALQGEGRAVDVSSLLGGITGPVVQTNTTPGGQHAVTVLQDPEVPMVAFLPVAMCKGGGATKGFSTSPCTGGPRQSSRAQGAKASTLPHQGRCCT